MCPSSADAALASSLRISVMRLARRLRLERSGDDLTLNQLAVLGTLDRARPAVDRRARRRTRRSSRRR